MVLRLVRQDFHHQAWQVKSVSAPCDPRVLGSHERAIARPEKKFRVHERAKQCIARRAIESPQPLRLSRSQTQTGHLDVLTLNAAQNVVECMVCGHVDAPRIILISGVERSNVEQPVCHSRLEIAFKTAPG